MLDEFIEFGASAGHWDWRVKATVAVLSIFISTRLITSLRSYLALWQTGDGKTPPISPYTVPGAGNLFSFGFDTHKCITDIWNNYGPSIPVRLRVANQKIYFISGAENVLALFRGSRDLTTKPSSILVLENAFGSPVSDRHIFTRDNTGINAQPLEGSDPIAPHNRIFHQVHKTLHIGLSGTGLADLATRFMSCLEAELKSLEIGDEWVDIPDLYSLIQQTAFKASTTAVCGPHLFRLNPSFTSDFWEFDSAITGLFKATPRWMIPKSYAVRDRMNLEILKWHEFAYEKFDREDEELAKTEWEEYYGSKLMRDRAKSYREVEGMTPLARAANDLGMIWGANANIVPIIGWTLIDTILRPELLAQCRAEIATAIDPSSSSPCGIDMPKLLANPLLQSIYAEELRLRNGVMIQRVPLVDNFRIGSWKFPKNKMIIASSWHEQRDRTVWNEGPVNGEFHSVEDFWPERFLVYPSDPSTGPRKPGTGPKSKTVKMNEKPESNLPKFTIDSVTGSFIPYGGGAKICPGRFYAKQEAMGGHALFLSMFDIELQRDKNDMPQPNMNFFPFGVVPPLGKFPARMRRRKQS